jgi:hypothetical protein
MKLGPKQEAWLQALESGEWPQTRLALHDNTGFCCLGVATESLGYQGVYRTSHELYTYWDEFMAVERSTSIPKQAKRELRLSSEGVGLLVAMNDELGYGFRRISQKVRKNPETYFLEGDTQ